jgi:hypothetical protein
VAEVVNTSKCCVNGGNMNYSHQEFPEELANEKFLEESEMES